MATIIEEQVPTLDVDLFSQQSLSDPFADYQRLRDAGPLVRLRNPDVYAIGQFGDVQNGLRAADTLVSGEGVGFSDVFNAPRGMNVIQSDGERHKRMRSTVVRPLTPAALKAVRPDLKSLIAERVRSLAGDGWFDAIPKLASYLPVQAISHLVGLPAEGRDRMLEWAAAAFNVIGPNQDPGDVGRMREAFAYMGTISEANVSEESWAGRLFAAARGGKLPLQEAMAAISAYVIPSLDTTILAKGHLLRNLATNPDQWRLLLDRPELIPSAVLEGVRHSSVLRWFSRVAAEDHPVGHLFVPRGARVMLLYGCANRDERRYDRPEMFDIARDARDHLAWGTGPHMCAGMHLARIEMEVMLEALVEVATTLEAGAPTLGVNAGLYGFTELPFRIGTTSSDGRRSQFQGICR